MCIESTVILKPFNPKKSTKQTLMNYFLQPTKEIKKFLMNTKVWAWKRKKVTPCIRSVINISKYCLNAEHIKVFKFKTPKTGFQQT